MAHMLAPRPGSEPFPSVPEPKSMSSMDIFSYASSPRKRPRAESLACSDSGERTGDSSEYDPVTRRTRLPGRAKRVAIKKRKTKESTGSKAAAFDAHMLHHAETRAAPLPARLQPGGSSSSGGNAHNISGNAKQIDTHARTQRVTFAPPPASEGRRDAMKPRARSTTTPGRPSSATAASAGVYGKNNWARQQGAHALSKQLEQEKQAAFQRLTAAATARQDATFARAVTPSSAPALSQRSSNAGAAQDSYGGGLQWEDNVHAAAVPARRYLATLDRVESSACVLDALFE